MAPVSSSSQTHSNTNQHYEITNSLHPYNLTPELFFPQDLSTSSTLYTEFIQEPSLSTSVLPINFLDIPLSPTLPISVSPGLSSYDYDPTLTAGVTSGTTFGTFAHPTQTEPYQLQLDCSYPFLDYHLTNSVLFSDAPGESIPPVTNHNTVSGTTPAQPHHNTAVLLYHHLCNLTDQMKSWLDSHIHPEMPSSNPFSQNPIPGADPGYQPPNLASVTNSHTVDHLLHITLNSETQRHELSVSSPAPSDHQSPNHSEIPLASISQMHPTQLYQQLTTGSESSSDSVKSLGHGGAGGGRHYCGWDGCNKSFRRPYLLADHQRIHTGEPAGSK